MNLRWLRKELPTWTWRAERHGFGWQYVGTSGERRVRVYAVSVLCGPSEDDFATEWRADEGDKANTWAAFWLSEFPRRDG